MSIKTNELQQIIVPQSEDRGERVWDDCKLLLNGLIQDFDLLLQSTHGGD